MTASCHLPPTTSLQQVLPLPCSISLFPPQYRAMYTLPLHTDWRHSSVALWQASGFVASKQICMGFNISQKLGDSGSGLGPTESLSFPTCKMSWLRNRSPRNNAEQMLFMLGIQRRTDQWCSSSPDQSPFTIEIEAWSTGNEALSR